jgi:MFS family permease
VAISNSLGGLGHAFRSRNYRLFWTGQLFGNVGAWIHRLATAWLAWELTHSTAWLGIVASGAMLPALFLAPLGGTTSDRYGHRRQLMTSSCGTFTATFLAGVCTVADIMTIELLFVLALLQGLSRAFNVPARNSMVPSLVPPEHLSSAIGINSATYQGGNFVGPAIGGLLIAGYGAAACFFFYSVGTVIALITLSLLKIAPHPKREGRKRSLFGDLADGIKYTARHRGIRAVLLMATVTAMLVAPFQDMHAGISDLVFDRGAAGLATLASSAGLGAMCAGLWVSWRGKIEGLVRIELGSVLVAALGLIVYSLSHTFWLSCVATTVIAFSMVCASVSGDSLAQNSVDPSMRARVTSVETMINIGFPAMGAILIGWAGTIYGIQLPLTISASIAVGVWLVIGPILWKQRHVLERPRPTVQPDKSSSVQAPSKA